VTGPSFAIAVLGREERSGFRSGSEPLDRYFRTQVTQDIRRRMAVCYVATDVQSGALAGFYTLSAADLPVTEAPPDLTGKLPRYPTLPAARIGRLAVDERFRGRKLGSVLLADATIRAAGSGIAVVAMVVDAKDANAEAFYRHHGFVAYGSAPGRMLASMRSLLAATGDSPSRQA
jgi:GNAT superfamily N-acetyltransferase